MSRLHRRLGEAGICIIIALMLASCGEIEESARETSIADEISTEVLRENVPFEIERETASVLPESTITTGEIHLLVAIDNSGSMKPSGRVIHDTIEMISALVEKELPVSSVEYMLFNAGGTEFVSADELFPINYGGETSIYLGMEQVNAWLEEHVQNDKEQGIRTALILFSDLYSSRTAGNGCYTEDTAKEEQETIKSWAESWNAWIGDECLNACVIQWESMAEGESSSRTLDQELDSYAAGFQVQLAPLGDHLLELGDVKLDKDNQNIQIEQRVVGNCLERVLEVITGVTGQTWKDMGEISRSNNPMTLRVNTGYKRLIIRIDSTGPDNNCFEFFNSETGAEYPAERIFEGEVTNVYMAGEAPVGRLGIRAVNSGLHHVYYLTIPQITVKAKFEKSSGRAAVGEEIAINIIAECGEDDIRWNDTPLPLNICIEIEDINNKNRMVYEESLCADPGDRLILTPRNAGNFRVIIYCVDSTEDKREIGRATFSVK